MRLLTPHTVQLMQAMHLFITTQGTATIEGTALGDDDQTPQVRPTEAIWINATTGTDITVDPDLEWTAIHYTVDCAEDDPTLTEWQTSWAAEVNRLDDVTLNDNLTQQAMEPPGRTARTHRDPTKHTLWHYPATIYPEAVTQIKEALYLTLPDTLKRPRAGGVHNILELPNRHRHGAPGRRAPTCRPPSRHSPRWPKPERTERVPRRTGHRTSLSSNTPTTTPTKHSRQDAKYTCRYATKTVTSSPTARRWYASY